MESFSNKALSRIFKRTAQLLELHGENKFKTGSYSNSSFQIGRMERPIIGLPQAELETIKGIGKSAAAKIVELAKTGELEYLNKLVEKTPTGVIDMLDIKGIGPSKIRIIWKELEVESLGELLYACNENRLVDLKGFGAKTQEQVRQAIRFKLDNAGKFHYAAIEEVAENLVETLREKLDTELVSLTGAMRRKDEIIEKVEVLIGSNQAIDEALLTLEPAIAVEVIHCEPERFVKRLFETTATAEHLDRIKLDGLPENASEEAIYEANQLPFIVPEMRMGDFEFTWAEKHQAEDLVTDQDLKGILHNHSTWSDGQHSLRQMAEHCRDLGFEYLGMCDHSKSAFYANGLSAERVAEQQQEIDTLNQELAPFRIFKGIESDILNDGKLDYEESVLQSFDFIVASVHSNLKMNEEKATARLITAIENPYTTILGHPTGRLLLSRAGYPIDHQKIIDACAQNGVSIELNANPFRLDLDWRWIPYALEQDVRISINPDAHAMSGYQHMHFGVCAARKGGLLRDMTLNALSAQEIELYFQKR